ncbi:Gen1p, variant 2 [Perkinsus olseni]|uniref:Gen1p, variant 2 n=1 Tax=Perkinsus olseni TaxID=32597 RepID=A0A7J6PME5_PEROL|nr:Gen1p, variant 2 [Perkinsus olseni]
MAIRPRRNWTETEVVSALTAFADAVGDRVTDRSELSDFRKLGLSWPKLVDANPPLVNRTPMEARRKVKVILTDLSALSHDYDGQRYFLARWPSLPDNVRDVLIGEPRSAASSPATAPSTSEVSSNSLDLTNISEAVTSSQAPSNLDEGVDHERQDCSPESAKSARSALEETWDSEGGSSEDEKEEEEEAGMDACVDDAFNVTEVQSATSQLGPAGSQMLEASQVSTVPPLEEDDEEEEEESSGDEIDRMLPLFTARGDHRDYSEEASSCMIADTEWFDACEVVLNEGEEKELAEGQGRAGPRLEGGHLECEEVKKFVCGLHEDGWPDILMIQESNLSAHRAQICYFHTHLRRYEFLTGYKSQVHDTGILVNCEKFSVARPVPEELLMTVQERLVRAHCGAIPPGQLAAALGRICVVELEHEKMRSRFFVCSFHATRHQANACSSAVLLFLQELSDATRMPVLLGGDFNCDIVDLLDGNPDLDNALPGLTVAEYSYKRHRFKGNRDKLIDRLAVINPRPNREFDLKLGGVAACCFEETLFVEAAHEPGARVFDHLPIMGQLVLGENWNLSMDLLWLLERPAVPCTPLQLDARGVPTNNQSAIYQPPSTTTTATAHPYYRGPPLNTLGHHRPPPPHQPHHHQHHPHQQQQQLRMMPPQPRQSSFDQTIGTALIDQTIPLAAHPLSSHLAAFPPYAMQIGGGLDMARAHLSSGPVRPASPARSVGRRKDYAAPPGVWKNSGGYVSTVYVNKRRLYGPLRRTVTEATEDRRRLLSAKESHATESEVRDLIASMRQGANAHSPGQARDPIFPRDIAGNPLTDLRGLPPGPPPSRATIYGGSLSTFQGRPGSLPLPSHLSLTPPLDSGFLEADVYEPSYPPHPPANNNNSRGPSGDAIRRASAVEYHLCPELQLPMGHVKEALAAVLHTILLGRSIGGQSCVEPITVSSEVIDIHYVVLLPSVLH